MAITKGDGAIILSTKVDTSGVNKGMNSINSVVKKAGATIAAAFSVSALVNFGKAASELATQTEASIGRIIDIYGQASDTVGDFIKQNARALGMSQASATSFASTYGNLLSVWADQETNAKLTNALLNQTAVVSSKTGRTVEDVMERIRSGMLGNTEAIEDLGINVNIKTIEMTDAFKRIADGKSWEQLNAYEQSQIRTLAILEQSTEKYGTEVAQTSATVRNELKAAYDDFRNTFGELINTVLVPLMEFATEVLTYFTIGLQELSEMLGLETGLDTLKSQTDEIGNSTDKQKELTDAVKETDKAQKGLLAGFDTLNTIVAKTEDSEDASGAPLGDLGLEDLDASAAKKQAKQTNETLDTIMEIVGGALVAVGMILLFTGNILWGIGFIIAGAAIFGVTQANPDSSKADTETETMLHGLMVMIAYAMVVIGVLLLFVPGAFGLALGLIFAGGTVLAGEVAFNSEAVVEAIRGPIGAIMAIVGGSLLVLGILLLFVPGAWGIALGLIAAGAASLVTVSALNWDSITQTIKEFTERAGKIISDWWNGLVGDILGFFDWFGDSMSWNSTVEAAYWTGGTVPDPPRLAKGAVIPPNREFLAVLGDQKHGTNIEAPLDTIVEAFKAVQGTPSFTIEAKGKWSQFIKMMNLEIKKESERSSIY